MASYKEPNVNEDADENRLAVVAVKENDTVDVFDPEARLRKEALDYMKSAFVKLGDRLNMAELHARPTACANRPALFEAFLDTGDHYGKVPKGRVRPRMSQYTPTHTVDYSPYPTPRYDGNEDFEWASGYYPRRTSRRAFFKPLLKESILYSIAVSSTVELYKKLLKKGEDWKVLEFIRQDLIRSVNSRHWRDENKEGYKFDTVIDVSDDGTITTGLLRLKSGSEKPPEVAGLDEEIRLYVIYGDVNVTIERNTHKCCVGQEIRIEPNTSLCLANPFFDDVIFYFKRTKFPTLTPHVITPAITVA